MTDETTTSEQLAEIEGQGTDYTPPEGWQSVPLGQVLNEIYIRPIEIEPEPQPEPVQVREGRWKTRNGEVKNIKPTPADHVLADSYPWWDGRNTWRNDGRFDTCDEHPLDLLEYLGPIEAQPEAQPEPQPQPSDTIDELRSEVSHVQRLLGESRQRVTALEELVVSLRTINDAAEKAIHAAGTENTALLRQLAVAKEELKIAAAVCKQLQIELDAAQQVPADSPELRQLRLDLAEVTQDRDQYKTAYDRIFADLLTTRETATADTVEAIVEWLEPFRGCNSPSLALLLIEALPSIIRSLTGLNTEDVD